MGVVVDRVEVGDSFYDAGDGCVLGFLDLGESREACRLPSGFLLEFGERCFYCGGRRLSVPLVFGE